MQSANVQDECHSRPDGIRTRTGRRDTSRVAAVRLQAAADNERVTIAWSFALFIILYFLL